MTYPEIEKLAREKYKEAGALVPVPVVEIAKKLGLSIVEIQMPSFDAMGVPSGVLTKDDNAKWSIVLNESEKHTRKRFTIAHEIGHFLIHANLVFVDAFPAGETFYRGAGGDESSEKDANYFAANLLMPTEKVKEVWQVDGNISELARKFDVSEVSMTFRLKSLGLIESA
jgi:Zn-dependent peptidase ImmA (M78 family)